MVKNRFQTLFVAAAFALTVLSASDIWAQAGGNPEGDTRPSAQEPTNARERLAALQAAREARRNRAGAQTGAPARARPQRRSEIQRQRNRARSESSARTSVALPKVQIPASIKSDTLYFRPAQIRTKVHSRFSTPLHFYNPNERSIDRIDIWVYFDPELLDAISINTGEIDRSAAGKVTSEVWRDQGFVHIQASFEEPLRKLSQPLAVLEWMAKGTSASTVISIESPKGEGCGVYEDSVNCLELSAVGNRGRGSVRVGIANDAGEIGTRVLLEPGQDPTQPEFREAKGIHLAMRNASKTIEPEKISTLDIVMLNPHLARIDDLRFAIRYDAASIEILDADQGNSIVTGINIFDGDSYDDLPFDEYRMNDVDADVGLIRYWASSRTPLLSEKAALVARVVYRVKKQTGSVRFKFVTGESEWSRISTDVSYRGRSLLGPESGNAAAGLHGASIELAPIEMTSAAP